MAKSAEVNATVAECPTLRVKTKDVCRMLSCDEKTLRNWEKKCPSLFSPVLRQRNGNIYRPRQVELMADVMDKLKTPEEGAELWKRTLNARDDAIYREAGDKSRGARK